MNRFITLPLYCKVLVGGFKGQILKVVSWDDFPGHCGRVELKLKPDPDATAWYRVNEVEIAPVNFV